MRREGRTVCVLVGREPVSTFFDRGLQEYCKEVVDTDRPVCDISRLGGDFGTKIRLTIRTPP